MSKFYRTREAPITALDTRTALTFLGSATAESPSNVVVPKGATKLVEARASLGHDFAVASSNSFFFRLEGDGLEDSPVFGPIAAFGSSVATGIRRVNPSYRIPLDVPVIPGNSIAISAEQAGADGGTIAAGVTLVFS